MPAPSGLFSSIQRFLGFAKSGFPGKRQGLYKGFVLPIAILIVLVLTLITVGLVTRSTQRNQQTQIDRARQLVIQQVPAAIDRARAKIDALSRDTRLPNSTPSDPAFTAALLNDGSAGIQALDPDPYTLPDETRFTIEGAGGRAAAWWFTVDSNNDGENDSVASYMILVNRSVNRGTETNPDILRVEDNVSRFDLARSLVIGRAPLSGDASQGCQDIGTGQTVINPNQGDWFQIGSQLIKPFQVFAISLPTANADSTVRGVSATEFYTDRRRNLLNKWGAFSRQDIEVFVTPPFNWNGAIYAGGSLFFERNNLVANLISAPPSCFYLPRDNSEIVAFREFVAGTISSNQILSSPFTSFHAHPGPGVAPVVGNPDFVLSTDRDSIEDDSTPANVALDPLRLHVFDQFETRGAFAQDPDWASSPLNTNRTDDTSKPGRVKARDLRCPPYVDDVYRADNRFGPKSSYDRPPLQPVNGSCAVRSFNDAFNGATAGGNIPNNAENNNGELLVGDEPANITEMGLDGYWERRARREGLRVIVGQRLELTRSSSFALPLLPPGNSLSGTTDPRKIQPTLISNQARQRMTLRDNPAAVQATAVYHYSRDRGAENLNGGGGYYPVACLATTAHPGSAESLRRASTFPNDDATDINFFTGAGTNVWEFDPPPESAFQNDSSPLMVALRNLAFFSGDPEGAYPPVQEAGEIHPDPFLTAYGNFSELRRLFSPTGLVTPYADLSLADRTTLHTAGCTLGMLAWNMGQIGATTQLGIEIADSRDNGTLDHPRSQRLYSPLWYIFPTVAHTDNLNRINADSNVNSTYTYAVVSPADVAITRRPSDQWVLPYSTLSTCPAGAPNSSSLELIRIGNGCRRVAFKDSVIYDGREAMAVRLLNIDLALLTNNVPQQSNGLISNDTWLPSGTVNNLAEGGIFYAFREDAVREDAIARPPLDTFASYQTAWNAANGNGNVASNLIMNAGQSERNDPIGDPPRSAAGISPKPVDYVADPDRRPYGFRLRNGAVLQRGGFLPDESLYGLSFISDNSVSIQGDFNLHQPQNQDCNNDNDCIEEFNQRINYNADGAALNFYTRTALNESFARAAGDRWRPTDVLGDSVSVLSENFCDGSMDDAWVQDGTLNGFGTAFNPARDVTSNGQMSSPRRVNDYGCTDIRMDGTAGSGNTFGNTSFTNQALIQAYSGLNWPADDPNANGAGIRRFDNTQGAQDLGMNTQQPGWADVFARDTVVNSFTNANDTSLGKGVPANRDVRPPDVGYVSFGARISDLGNPVLDTSRWLQVAAQGRCPVPDPAGRGLAGEYYNGWISNPQALYIRDTGFISSSTPVDQLLSVSAQNNLRFLRAVRWPDPIFPQQGVPDNLATVGQPWSLVRNVTNTAYPANPDPLTPPPNSYARYRQTNTEALYPFNWGGFRYQWGGDTGNNSHSPFRRTLHSNTACTGGTLVDLINPACINNDIKRLFWIPSCTEPVINPLDNAPDIANNPAGYNFRRTCWRRRSGGNNSGNQNGNDYFAVRWVGEFYPMYAGNVPVLLDTDDGGRLIIRRNPAFTGTIPPLNQFEASLASTSNNQKIAGCDSVNCIGREDWRDKGAGAPVTLTANLACADPSGPSPYLIEIQQYENTGSAAALLSIRDPANQIERYDLRYLKPITPSNLPCDPAPNPGTPHPNSPFQDYCDAPLNCTPVASAWAPACPTTCTPIPNWNQTRTFSLPAGCPGTAPTPESRTITCQPPPITFTAWAPPVPACPNPTCTAIVNEPILQTRVRNDVCAPPNPTPETRTEFRNCPVTPPTAGPWSAWAPACTPADGGTTILQTRTRTITNPCGSNTTETQTRNEPCPLICNYADWGPWTPPCPDNLAPGTSQPHNQTRTRTILPGQSPGCQASQTESQTITCFGPNPSTLPEDMRPNSPFGGNHLHAMAPAPEAHTQVAVRPSAWTNALSAVFDWVFGEPVHAAQLGLPEQLLPSTISNPRREPGIRPAMGPGLAPPAALPATPTQDQLNAHAIALRNVFMQCPSDLPSSIDNGFWVPGVFRPNFSTTFTYVAYNGTSLPSTLRFAETEDLNGNGTLDPGEDLNGNGVLDTVLASSGTNTPGEYDAGEIILDRDPLFGFNADGNLQANNFPDLDNNVDDVQPQMRLNPYARARDNNNQNYLGVAPNGVPAMTASALGTFDPGLDYLDGYFIDAAAPSIRNGLCFYVRQDGGRVQIQLDRNGNANDGLGWVTVESLRLNNNAPTTGFSGTSSNFNPVLGVILDERTRRPIPIPNYQPLVSTNDQQRKRRNNGEPVVNGQLINQLIPASPTRVNTLAIGGQLPSRPNQSNGGLHNFLRLNELWTKAELFFSGSMIQLNYSTSATGPWAQDYFEPVTTAYPGAIPAGFGNYDYYFPPRRRFGYDVGLLIARRPSPVARRFEVPSDERTELLQSDGGGGQLSSRDPYVRRLRCGLQGEVDDLDPSVVLPAGDCNFN
ncbi:MAG: type II secretion system protein [Cyanobacteriota bacterium]